MEFQPLIHPRIYHSQANISQEDILQAWNNALASAPVINESGCRQVWLTLGYDRQGRLLELASIHDQARLWMVFHAMTPPSHKTIQKFLSSGRD